MIRSTDVAVVGGGAVGLHTGLQLARRGMRVAIFDRGAIAGQASSRNGGQISPAIDAGWAPFARRCLEMWPPLAAELRDVAYRRAGGLHALMASAPADPAEIVAYRRERGLVAELVDPRECARLVPGMTTELKGGVLSPKHGQLDPFLANRAVARLTEEAGASLHPDTAVTGVEVVGGRVTGIATTAGAIAADVVVDAAGPWGTEVAALAGIRVPVRPRRIEILRSAPIPRITEMVWSGNGLYSRQDAKGRIHFGAEGPPWDPSPEHFVTDVTAPTMQRIASRMLGLMPGLRDVAIERAWSGILAMTPDLMPIVDALASPKGFVLATGFGGNGFGTSPAFGEAVAQLICDGKSALDTAGFRLGRFVQARTARPADEPTMDHDAAIERGVGRRR